jgi:hypothetical protein
VTSDGFGYADPLAGFRQLFDAATLRSVDQAMFQGWSEYFFMIGSSAAALIGLMFVVVTLTAGHASEQVERGKHLYTSPIVWHLAVVLVLSGAAIAPAVTPRIYGVVSGALALLGIAIGARSAVGIARSPGAPEAAGFDMFWYGVAPLILYVGLGAVAIGILEGASWGAAGVAADLMALLLVSIHAEWDLVTYLAPIANPRDRP